MIPPPNPHPAEQRGGDQPPHPYCRHDEGERCGCDRDLKRGKEGISRR